MTETATSDSRDTTARGGWGPGVGVGAILVAIGALLLAGQLVPDVGQYIVLIIGLVLLAGFAATRAYGFLVPGSIVTGIGVGIMAAEVYPALGGLFLLSLAAGFAGIWVLGSLFRLRENHWWPLVPAGILAAIGFVALIDADGRLGDVTRLGWPIALVIVGALIVLRAARRSTERPQGER